MRTLAKFLGIVLVALMATQVHAQQINLNRNLDNFRYPDKRGVNVFESPKDTTSNFHGVDVRVGGSFALQYQAIENENSELPGYEIKEAGSNFNLATANLDLDVALYDGVRMHLRTYLSSRHHNEPYVKGGYFQIDKLEFIKPGFLEDLMQYTTIKVGHMENNYGDAHFRRSDNAQALYNPFVGNLIMDAFTTEVGAEVYYRRDGFIGMVGFTNGKLNQNVDENEAGKSGGASFLAKLGYDKQLNNDLRVRLTGSLYNTGYSPKQLLYSADRAGARYYGLMQRDVENANDDFRASRYNPNMLNNITAVMINPFVKYKGLEFFGTVEMAKGKKSTEIDERTTMQYAGELIYRFGADENIYVGGRYNLVDAEDISGGDVTIDRFQVAAGWFMTRNILLKAEYVIQNYNDFPEFGESAYLNDAKFNGAMVEAVISF